MTERPQLGPDARGLCPRCVHVREVRSARGSVFLLCRWPAPGSDQRKYPPQPVLRCPGFEQAGPDDG